MFDLTPQDLAEIVTALRISGPLTMAGHSMGGMAALSYLARAATDLAADCAACNGPHQCTSPRAGVLHCHRGLAASLTRHGHLLVNGGA